MAKKSIKNEILAQIGEKEMLNRLKEFMDIGQIDDDTAIIKCSNNELLVNTDVLVEDVHFNETTMTACDIGWKLIAANISDLNASGLNQLIGVTVALITPPETKWDWIYNLYTGMKTGLDQFGGKIIGGDCSKGKQKIISVTAFGSSGPLRLHRSNAKPGDYLITTGAHGLSRLGLGLLEYDPICQTAKLTENLKRKAINAHQRPFPPIDKIQKLLNCKPINLPWRAAGTDTSDGLLEALHSIAISSNCTAILEYDNLPKPSDWPIGSTWDKWLLNGGEDYEVVLSLPPAWAEEWAKTEPSLKNIGKIVEGEPQVIWSNNAPINFKSYSDFKHF